MNIREKIIENYIEGYNNFDISKMTADLHNDITFQNIANGELNLILKGLQAFIDQAELTITYFRSRHQKIRLFTHLENNTEIELDYHAVLAMDLPNGLKSGQELILTGKSIFEFDRDKIIKLTDIS